jgi:tight adherence protein B
MTFVASLVAFAAVFLAVLGLDLAARDRRARAARARLGLKRGLKKGSDPFLSPRLSFELLRRRSAERRLVAQLPDAVRSIARGMRAGQSVDASLHEAGRSLPDPAGREFLRVREEIALGVPFEDAVRSLADRHRAVPELRFLAGALALQRRTGGSLGDLLDPLAATLAERAALRREVRALTAEGRATAWVIGALPVAFLAITGFVRPEYASLLFEHPTGRVLLIGAAALELAGFAAMRRIARVEV